MHQNGRVPDPNDPADEAARTLYAVPPEEFLTKRAELAAQARQDGEAVVAKAIERLRKPTVGAWIVNALAARRPEVVDELKELGGRLREAQDALDAGRMRELTAERRSLLAKLAKEAFGLAGRKDPPAGLRDEVTGTLEAAIADPDVASRLGRLQRAEQWSGFGFAPSGAPELTLVRGGRDTPPSRPRAPEKPKRSASEKRRQERALASAREAFEAAEAAHDQSREAEKQLSQEIKRLTKKLSKMQSQLDDARSGLESARKDVTSARAKRRETRSALDRAEREAGD
jgi:hypothetical protein